MSLIEIERDFQTLSEKLSQNFDLQLKLLLDTYKAISDNFFEIELAQASPLFGMIP